MLFRSDSLYVPKVESVIRLARNRRINKEFTGFNHKELAVKYGLTTRHIRTIVEREKDGASQAGNMGKQLELF